MRRLEKAATPSLPVTATSEPERMAAGHAWVPKLIATRTFGIIAPASFTARTRTAGEIAWPPIAPAGCVTNWICVPAGTGFVTRMVYGAEATAPIRSVALTVKLYAPPAVGVPLRFPLEPSVSPGGSVPVLDHVYGETPAAAENV